MTQTIERKKRIVTTAKGQQAYENEFTQTIEVVTRPTENPAELHKVTCEIKILTQNIMAALKQGEKVFGEEPKNLSDLQKLDQTKFVDIPHEVLNFGTLLSQNLLSSDGNAIADPNQKGDTLVPTIETVSDAEFQRDFSAFFFPEDGSLVDQISSELILPHPIQ